MVPESPEPMHPGIQALVAACSEKILNRDYLLQGDGNPFVSPADNNTLLDLPLSTSSVCGGEISTPSTSQDSLEDGLSELELELETEDPRITLYSQKMKGLKDLLLGEKLNTHAVSLQLTAQSQVQVTKKTSRNGEESTGPSHRPKRTRRE